MPQKASPYSPMNLAQKLGSPSTIDFLLGGNRVPYNKLEAQPTKGSGAPKRPQKALYRHKRRHSPQKALTTKGHKSKGKPMHKSKGKNTRSAQVLHSQIPPKATNACGGRREEEQRKTQQMELQELDRKGSTH